MSGQWAEGRRLHFLFLTEVFGDTPTKPPGQELPTPPMPPTNYSLLSSAQGMRCTKYFSIEFVNHSHKGGIKAGFGQYQSIKYLGKFVWLSPRFPLIMGLLCDCMGTFLKQTSALFQRCGEGEGGGIRAFAFVNFLERGWSAGNRG